MKKDFILKTKGGLSFWEKIEKDQLIWQKAFQGIG